MMGGFSSLKNISKFIDQIINDNDNYFIKWINFNNLKTTKFYISLIAIQFKFTNKS